MICVFFLKNIDLIYLCAGSFFAPLRHSLVLESGGFSSWGDRLLIAVAPLMVEHGL